MVLITAVLAMGCVYYGYDRGFVIGFMLALFLEILSLVLVYNILKRNEEQLRMQFSSMMETQRASISSLETIAGRRGETLDFIAGQHPQLCDIIAEKSGEAFPRREAEPASAPEKTEGAES
ncbi:hypothetical protein LZ24_01740 [Desulfobotulus alkaliphilus]|uniref:Uncharacterized protein n=1 Tax=Desulfobotulus alkaliphilus TaxID=622671 RepID=A0A562RT30_9BACT|nr:hypothetical protein [Desulfobotulus alkaliphilus]TWI71724.1 hypothetical protein LZ24_01740 [Desulfobotulus alkaliphilus]